MSSNWDYVNPYKHMEWGFEAAGRGMSQGLAQGAVEQTVETVFDVFERRYQNTNGEEMASRVTDAFNKFIANLGKNVDFDPLSQMGAKAGQAGNSFSDNFFASWNPESTATQFAEKFAGAGNKFTDTIHEKWDAEKAAGQFAEKFAGAGNKFADTINEKWDAGKTAEQFADKFADAGNKFNDRFFDNWHAEKFGENFGRKGDQTLNGFWDNFNLEDHTRRVGQEFTNAQSGFREELNIPEMTADWAKDASEAFKRGTDPLIESATTQLFKFLMGITSAAAIPMLVGTTLTVGTPLAMFYTYYKLKHNIGRPVLATETRNITMLTPVYNAITAPGRLVSGLIFGKKEGPKAIFNSEITQTLREIKTATINLKKNGGCFENVLLYGPGGTGKTMAARQLAEESNLSYMQMTSASLAQSIGRKEHTSDLNKLMKWAKSKPTVLFIDEAESILRDREILKNCSPEYMELQNAFLNHTGTQSQKLMIIAATNRLEDLDEAVLSRFTHKIYVGPPAFEDRKKIIMLYAKEYFTQPEIKQFFTDSKVSEIAEKIDGFTGRAIFQMINSLSNKKLSTLNNKLTTELIDRTVNHFQQQEKDVKSRWEKARQTV